MKEPGIVGVRIGVTVLVMKSMVSTPVVYIILERHAMHDHEQNSKWQLCFVGSMRPKSVTTGEHAHRGEATDHVDVEHALPRNVRIESQCPVAVQSAHVQRQHAEHIAPHDLTLERYLALGVILLGLTTVVLYIAFHTGQ